MTTDEVKILVSKYVSQWNSDAQCPPLWVTLASPGDSVNIPGVTFGAAGAKIGGMELPVHAQPIVLDQIMVPESLLASFFHGYWHAQYRQSQKSGWNAIDSEVAAIKFTLEALTNEGLDALAYREAAAVKEMSTTEPYKSAVARLSDFSFWKKYG